MTNHIDRVREQAEKEAVGVFGKQREADLLPADYYQAGQMSGYIMGQIALASRLIREKIADTLANINNFGPERVTPGPLEHAAADAILALLTVEQQR
jgi:hypothetical protein